MTSRLNLTAIGVAAALSFSHAASAEEITIATVNNADMITMQELAPAWEEETGNKINWVVLEENVLRQRTTTDIATGGGSFDIMFIGAYETPIWGAMSANGSLYALPLYSETSFTFYRTDLFEAAGVEVPTEQISYTEFAEMAAKLHDPDNGIYGTCQRGKAGWGENMAFVGTVANAFGARWFDMDWKPQLDSPEWSISKRSQRKPCIVQRWQMCHLG